MSTKVKENLKSLIIVVLFITTILLLYLVFDEQLNVKFSNLLPFARTEEALNAPDATGVSVPSRVIYSNGSGAFTVVENREKVFDKSIEYVSEISRQSTMIISDISKDQYDYATTKCEALMMQYSYEIPFKEFCEAYDIKRSSGFSGIDNINDIAFSSAATDSVFFSDIENEKYFRIVFDSQRTWMDAVLNGSSPKGQSVYSMEQVFGIQNNILIPVAVSKKTDNLKIEAEDFSEDSELHQKVAGSIFGENFSFVRKIKSTFGDITYMYGYGAKTLQFDTSGTVIYKVSDIGSGSSRGFFDDLQTAINFIARCGGYEFGDGRPKLVLASVEYLENGERFNFLEELEGMPIGREEGYNISVSVENGQVSYFFRDATLAQSPYTIKEKTVQADAAIASSSIDLYKKYLSGVGAGTEQFDESDAFNYAAENLAAIEMEYKEDDGFLIPSWHLVFNDGSETWIGLKQKQY